MIALIRRFNSDIFCCQTNFCLAYTRSWFAYASYRRLAPIAASDAAVPQRSRRAAATTAAAATGGPTVEPLNGSSPPRCAAPRRARGRRAGAPRLLSVEHTACTDYYIVRTTTRTQRLSE